MANTLAMRIVGGKLKGKKINFIKSIFTRPLRDMVRENIFNIILHSNSIDVKIENSSVLDLYSGVGSFGIECFSRGAEKISFVEKNYETLKILKNNLINLKMNNKSIIHEKSVDDFLKINNEKFNIVFFDPPFSENNYLQQLRSFYLSKAFNKNNLIIIHREGKNSEKIQDFLKIIKIVKYGRSKIIFGTLN